MRWNIAIILLQPALFHARYLLLELEASHETNLGAGACTIKTKDYKRFNFYHVAPDTYPHTKDGAVHQCCRRNTGKRFQRKTKNTVLFDYYDETGDLPNGMEISAGSCAGVALEMWSCHGIPTTNADTGKTEAECISECDNSDECRCTSCKTNYPNADAFYVEVNKGGHLVLENIGYVAEGGRNYIKIPHPLDSC